MGMMGGMDLNDIYCVRERSIICLNDFQLFIQRWRFKGSSSLGIPFLCLAFAAQRSR